MLSRGCLCAAVIVTLDCPTFQPISFITLQLRTHHTGRRSLDRVRAHLNCNYPSATFVCQLQNTPAALNK
eukprot:363506-Chlamydomonas_euryale.AAC.5